MQDRITLTRGGLVGVAVLLVSVAMLTALLLYYVAGSPPALVILITCLSPAAMVLLLYVGHLLYSEPDRRGYLVALKALGVASICMGLLVLLDFVLPAKRISTVVRDAVPRGHEVLVHLGKYEKSIPADKGPDVFEGQPASLEVTPLFHRIENVEIGEKKEVVVRRSTVGKIAMLATGLLFLLPIGLIRYTPDANDPVRNKAAFFLVVAPSYVLSLVATGLWVKLLLVHGLHTIETM